jgi:hypothetical protein
MFMGFTGWDMHWYAFPERWQASRVARELLRTTYKGIDLTTTRLIVKMPRGAYRVVDQTGKVEPATSDVPTL